MKVLKFGGTSVGSPERIRNLMSLINRNERQIVVLSAVAGTTNSLVAICNEYSEGKNPAPLIDSLNLKYGNFIGELFVSNEFRLKAKELIEMHFSTISSFSNGVFTPIHERVILAQGELISTHLFHYHLQETGIPSVLLPALDFMKINEDSEPEIPVISEKLNALLAKYPESDIFITQGYICRNAFGEIDNLKRGGSDYTASLIGAALQAEEIQIWTDIDGMHNNDPRIVKNTRPIAQLSFEEAAELAYFGAKILHPQSVIPAQKHKVPVRLLNTMQPEAPGTLISDQRSEGEIKAVAAKDGIYAIKIQSTRMLLVYGFLRKVFEVFERYKTPIDMVTTSEVAVSLTIDNPKYINEITSELESYGQISVDTEQTIICVVGDFVASKAGIAARVLDTLKHIPLRMISYGGSRNNISILLDTSYKEQALQSLQTLFN
ncbi:MAG TPA: aspartate kinase [Anseongella sp.]|nr:aspartate kinase [Anseongella sp.]